MIRNVVFLGFLALLMFLVLGWFNDWYNLKGMGSQDGKTQVQFEVDTNKLRADLAKGSQKLSNTIHSLSKDQGWGW